MDESKELAQIFQFEGHEFQAIMHNGKPAIFGNELCAALGYKNTNAALSKIPDHQKDGIAIRDSIGRLQRTPIVYEGGVYRLIFGSHMPNAIAFTDLVTDVILPSIRKTGKYESPIAKQITYIGEEMNPYCDWRDEQQKLKELDRLFLPVRNLAYATQEDEILLQIKTFCYHAFGIINNHHIGVEHTQLLLKDILQMCLDTKAEHEYVHTWSGPVYERMKAFVYQELAPIIERLARRNKNI